MGRKLGLTAVLKNIHGVRAIKMKGISYSHEFSDLGYPRHFTIMVLAVTKLTLENFL